MATTRSSARSVIVALLGCAVLLCAGTTFGAPTLVSDVPLPDPQVLQVEGEWCLFGTGAAPFFLHGSGLSPDRLRRKDLEIDYGGWPFAVHQVWGFTVYPGEEGRYHAYGTLHLGEFHTVVAHLEPAAGERWTRGHPIAKWKMTHVLLGDVAARDWSYYEAKLVREPDGPMYLVYCWNNGRNQNEIRVQRMRDPGQVDRRFDAQTILRPDGYRSEDRNEPGGLQLVEGASLTRIGSKWVLLYSVGDFVQPNYKLGVAYSDGLVPPRGEFYEKVLREDANRIWGNEGRRDEVAYLLQSSHPDWPHYCGNAVVGPGARQHRHDRRQDPPGLPRLPPRRCPPRSGESVRLAGPAARLDLRRHADDRLASTGAVTSLRCRVVELTAPGSGRERTEAPRPGGKPPRRPRGSMVRTKAVSRRHSGLG